MGTYLILWPSAAGGWRLLECGRLFGEIRYILTALAERVFLESVQLLLTSLVIPGISRSWPRKTVS